MRYEEQNGNCQVTFNNVLKDNIMLEKLTMDKFEDRSNL